ncbi:hydroxylamine reductase [Desulfallas sp. Bu1-1]|uniref:hydroxylamine reductase n=1 Tax=Desulfallas sp. Bu1-1 TaxID=2787620 RepID=UPI0018A009D7|nr:hydroxylamine reductase [Desulfallas sp. Bu1-1]MBF7083168.1 hydroxylamine reductase [Desulfallas sp. Bu1-1]
MFCNQCEQTARGFACTVAGVCGKTPEVSALQDLLLHAVKGLSLFAVEGRRLGIVDPEVNGFTVKAIFSTLTNVDFDPERFDALIRRGVELRERMREKVAQAGGKVDFADPAATFQPAPDLKGLIKQGESMGLVIDRQANEDIQSLQTILVYGIKGVSAYADHARILGQEDDKVFAFIHEGLAALTNKELTKDDWLKLVLKCGEINLRTLELLDKANTDAFGHPVPTEVPLGHKKGKCILVSGHDLKDLSDLLEQTGGKGIYVYTHGEMLPAHGYPGLKKHKHLYGHFGTAWQNQKKEFPSFPGAILMTTNCLQEPQESYLNNIFSTGLVGWPGVRHVENDQFGPVIEKALEMPGFPSDEDKGTVMVGFGRNALFGVSEKIIDLVKRGAIKHFFLVAGCDGAKPGRNYFTEFVQKVPRDSVVLTLACGKFRFFDLKLGDIEGIPRLIDIGQCNDAYSAIQIALALAKAFNCEVNDLPLHIVLSWYEQKAVAILLTLLYLGIKDIRLGPSLPAFISPNVLDVLVRNFNIKPISTPDEDLAAILNKPA